MPKPSFNPTTEIPSLKGKVILVTGGTAGLGRETVLSLASHDAAHIYFTGRSQSSADKVLEEVRGKHPNSLVTFLPCDLASLTAVQQAARDFVSQNDRLDIVMANAGIMAVPPGLTEDGYELQFGTNHLGHALLVNLLTPMLEATAKQTGDVRIIWNTSQGYSVHPVGGILFDTLRTPQADISWIAGNWLRYGQAKLANLLYARSYAMHHPLVTSVPIHPGVSATGLVTSLDFLSRIFVYITTWRVMISPEECAFNQQWAATAPRGATVGQVQSGIYYEPVGVKTKLLRDGPNDVLADELWAWTQKALEPYSL